MSFLSKRSVKELNNSQTNISSFRLSDLLNYMQGKGWYNVTATAAMTLYNKNSALADAVDTITSECKSIEPVIKRDDQYEYKHDILDLLKQPNPKEDWNDFMESLITNRLLTRNGFVASLGNIKVMPIELWVVPTTSIYAQGHGLDYAISSRNPSSLSFLDNDFIYDKKTGRLIAQNQMAELIQMSGFINQITTNGYIADSILSSILYELEVLNEGNNHNLSLLLNGVNLSGVFSVDTTDSKAIEQFKEDVRNYFGGSGNAGKYLVSKGKDVTFAPIQMTNKDMEQVTNVANARRVIYDRFQIPTPMRDNNAQTYDNYATAQYVFYDRTILPLIKDSFSTLTSFFRKRKILKENESISYDPTTITALQERFNAELKLKNELKIYTKNELRKMQGEKPYGPEADLLYQEFSLIPLGMRTADTGTEETTDEEVKTRFKNILIKRGYSDEEVKTMVEKYANSHR